MPKRRHQTDAAPHAAGSDIGWSIGSNGLTPSGQSDLLQHLGRQLERNYQSVLKEPTPDRFRQLLERLEERRGDMRDDDDR